MNLLPALATPGDVTAALAERLRHTRRERGWTQTELARRAGLSVATVARFEQTGQGQFASLLWLLAALGRLGDMADVLRPPPPTSLAELERRREPRR